MADQLNTISTTTTTVLTTLQTLMRRSKDNASELDNLRKQVLESKERDTQTVHEIKRLLSSTNSTTDLAALYDKLDTLRPANHPPPAAAPSAHKLDEEKAVVENILTNANQALTHLLTLTESINNLTSHLQTTATRLTTEESQLESLVAKKSTLEAEVARLEATIHLRNLELAAFTKKTEILESRILRAKTAVQLSGSKHIKMKKSPLISTPGTNTATLKGSVRREAPVTPISSQRRILSLSSTNNKVSPATAMTEFPGARKTSWQKRIGGMLSGLTSSTSNNKENNDGSGGSIRSVNTFIDEHGETDTGKDVLGLGVPAVLVRGRSVSERTK
jgi:myosin heavy subunit